jgi:NAD(P)-dependent dehydrogenase (short-subunit alcohol dehydrogenase family)
MAFIVTGGHSPIAIAISKRLSSKSTVFHISNQIDIELQATFSEHGDVVLENWDLGQTIECLEKFKKLLSDSSIEGVIFAHRYRSEIGDATKQFITEVETPYQLIKYYCNNYSGQFGSVVVFTSPAADSIVPDQDFYYHASKAALSQLVKFAAIKFKDKRVRTNGVRPGAFIEKERSRKYYSENLERLEDIKGFIPLGRMGSLDEIADVVNYLCSPQSSYVNGVIINIDGGYSNMESSFIL